MHLHELYDDFSEFYHVAVGVGTITIGFAAIYTAFTGARTFQEQRAITDQKILDAHKFDEQRKLKFKVAETAMDLAHKLKRDISFVRNPFIPREEMDALENEMDAEDFRIIRASTSRATAYVALRRLANMESEYSELAALKSKYKLIIGDDHPIESLLNAWVSVKSAALVLRRELPEPDKFLKLISSGLTEDDKINDDIDGAIEKIELDCSPILIENF